MELTIAQGLQIALYGFVTVFIMLATLMFIIIIMGKIVDATQAKKTEPVAQPETKAVVEEDVNKVDTTEYIGQISLIDVDEKTAACIMAIISDQTKIPLQNLIFKKITFIGEE